MISTEKKQQIINNLQQVPCDTVWGVGIQLFMQHVGLKSDAQIIQVVKDLQSQMVDGPENMKVVMGTTYDYFKNLPAAELSL